MVEITVTPGGSSGWHSHPGGAIVIVKQGSLITYHAVGTDRGSDGRGARQPRCEATSYTAGQAFIERPGEVDDVLNTGSGPYILYVTFPRVPPGGTTRIDQPDPGTCAGI